MALDSLDVSGGGTYVSLTPFHIGEAGSDGGQTNNNNNNILSFNAKTAPKVHSHQINVSDELKLINIHEEKLIPPSRIHQQ